MKARDKLNVWWIVAAGFAALAVAGAFGSNLLFVVLLLAALAWAVHRRHIR